MNDDRVPTEDLAFVLFDVLKAPAQLAELPAMADADEALMRQLLDEMGKFVSGQIAPLNRVGDEVGAQWLGGAVTMAPGFREAYQAFWQAGWPALSAAPEDGGEGLPAVLDAALYESLSSGTKIFIRGGEHDLTDNIVHLVLARIALRARWRLRLRRRRRLPARDRHRAAGLGAGPHRAGGAGRDALAGPAHALRHRVLPELTMRLSNAEHMEPTHA